MALTKAKKTELVEQLGTTLAGSPHAIVVGFQGIKVAEVDDLRRRIRAQGGHYAVVKNRLALRALKGTAYEPLGIHFHGPTAVAWSPADPVGLAKTLTDFAKDFPVLEFKGGVVDGQAVAGEEVRAIASLPSREALISKLLFLMQSPISRLVRGLGAIPQQFVSVLDQVRQQKQG